MPAPTWLIDEVLPARAVSMMYGPEGDGKSFWAVDWACHVAASLSQWQGRTVTGGPVVYVATEKANLYPARVQAWEQQYGAVARDFNLIDGVIELGSPTSRQQLLALIRQLPALPALIVVDTMGKSLGTEQENNATDMNRLLAGADALVRQTGAAVLLVHHSGNAKDRPRGSSGLRGGVAMLARLAAARRRNKAGTTVSLVADKLSAKREFPTLTRTFHEVTLPSGETSLVLVDRAPRPTRRTIDQALSAFTALPQPVTGTALGLKLGTTRQNGDKWLQRLESAGYATAVGRARYAPTPRAQAA